MATELAGSSVEFRSSSISFPALTPIKKRAAAIVENPEFREVLRKGSGEANHQFVAGHLEEIKAILRDRLQVRMGPEFAMMPEGRVYEEGASFERRMEEHYMEGRAALQTGDFETAAVLFESAAKRTTGLNSMTAHSFEAYSLMRLGEILRTRMILSPLCNGKCPLPSAYWNLACCLPDELQDERLNVLSMGLCKSPHMHLLYGAVSLGTLLGHKFLAQWLLCLPMVEALLLADFLTYDQADSAEKEASVLRLGAYVYDGEPSVPNPLEHILPLATTRAFFDAMLKRQKHAEVIDFWFRCRRRIAFMRYDYWKIKADYYEQFGRRNRAVNSFKTELYCRLNALVGKQEFRTNKMFLEATRMRVGIFLCRCTSPDLLPQGQAIHRMLSRFERNYAIPLLPCDTKLNALFGGEASSERLHKPGRHRGTAANRAGCFRTGSHPGDANRIEF